MPVKRALTPPSKSLVAVKREYARLARALAKSDFATGESRRTRGLKKMAEVVPQGGAQVMNELVEFSPDLARYIVDFAYGDVIARKAIDDRTRALIVIAALAALGNAQPQLQVHIGTALNSGCSTEDIIEALLIVSVYAGFPAALNGVAAARAAITAQPAKRKATRRAKRRV